MSEYPDGYVEAHLPDYPDERDRPLDTEECLVCGEWLGSSKRIAALEAEVDDFRTVVAGDRETGRKMWLAYHTAVAIEPIAADRDRLRAALKQIVACDFRGNMPREQAIARAALNGGGEG